MRFHPCCSPPLSSLWLAVVFLCYSSTGSGKGIVSPRLSLHWGIKLARDCSRELARSAGIAEPRAVPWAGRSPGRLPGCCGSERCRGGSGAALAPGHSRGQRWPAGSGSARASAGTGEQRGWKGRGRGKVRDRQCQADAVGIYPFDVRELLRYLS